MRVCGVSFEPRACVVALIEMGDDAEVTHIPAETRRISLGNHEDDVALRGFQQTARAFLTDNSVDVVAIKRCTYSGRYQSGASSIKMEALLQVLEFDTVLLAGQTVTREFGKIEISIPQSVLGYQHDAFMTAIVLGVQRVSV